MPRRAAKGASLVRLRFIEWNDSKTQAVDCYPYVAIRHASIRQARCDLGDVNRGYNSVRQCFTDNFGTGLVVKQR